MKFRLSNGSDSKDYRATSVYEFYNDLCDVFADNMVDQYQYFVDNKLVSFESACDTVKSIIANKVAQKELTHKKVWIHKGASNASNTWHQVYVKR